MSNFTYPTPTHISSYPIDEGILAAKEGKSIKSNPYKSPNTPKTDDVKSEAWLFGYMSYLHKTVSSIT